MEIREALKQVKVELRTQWVEEIDKLVEFLRTEKGYDHVDREIALEAVLMSFFSSNVAEKRAFVEWREGRGQGNTD